MSEENVLQVLVKPTAVLIAVETQEYPLFLSDVLSRNPNVTMPAHPLLVDIQGMGYDIVHPTDRPSTGVSTEAAPYQYDGHWYQNWTTRDKNEEELLADLNLAKDTARYQILAVRESDISKGIPWTLDPEPNTLSEWFHVQVRAEDKANLLVLNLKATAMEVAGSQELLEFRSYENISHHLTATQMIDMISGVIMAGEQLYKNSWVLSDLVKDATTLEELPEIPTTFIP